VRCSIRNPAARIASKRRACCHGPVQTLTNSNRPVRASRETNISDGSSVRRTIARPPTLSGLSTTRTFALRCTSRPETRRVERVMSPGSKVNSPGLTVRMPNPFPPSHAETRNRRGRLSAGEIPVGSFATSPTLPRSPVPAHRRKPNCKWLRPGGAFRPVLDRHLRGVERL